uniref:Uncharacterized protein n=1 Tax=Maylandia zebra TaxID=106582 RepID=A0A3P9DK73_9CICH
MLSLGHRVMLSLGHRVIVVPGTSCNVVPGHRVMLSLGHRVIVVPGHRVIVVPGTSKRLRWRVDLVTCEPPTSTGWELMWSACRHGTENYSFNLYK